MLQVRLMTMLLMTPVCVGKVDDNVTYDTSVCRQG